MTKFQSQAEAEADFLRLQHRVDVPRTLRASYMELETQFLTNEPYKQIAQRYGVSRQRIQQIYSKYFQPFMDTPKQRVAARLAVSQANRVADGLANTTKRNAKLAALKSALEAEGLSLEILPTKNYGGNTFTVKVGEHICRVQIARAPMSTSPKSHRLYWRFNLTQIILESHEFYILVCGTGGEEDFFILPTKLLMEYYGSANPHWSICIESQNLPAYNNQWPRIPWWDYNKAWSQLA